MCKDCQRVEEIAQTMAVNDSENFIIQVIAGDRAKAINTLQRAFALNPVQATLLTETFSRVMPRTMENLLGSLLDITKEIPEETELRRALNLFEG